MAQLYRSLLWATLLSVFFHVGSFAQSSTCTVSVTASGPLSFCKGGNVVLSASFTDPKPTYTWRRGNTTLPETSDKLTIVESGNYTVEAKGDTCASKTSEVFIVTVHDLPKADFTFTNDVCSGTSIKFTNVSTGDGLRYSWDFGDPGSGNTSSDKDPNHVFTSIGGGVKTYSVKLTVTNREGCTDTEIKTVRVKQQPDIILADLTRTPGNPAFSKCNSTSSNSDYLVRIENRSLVQSNTTYIIDWGDNSSHQISNSFSTAEHTYKQQGSFNLRVTATRDGCVTILNQQVYNGSNPSITVGSPGNTVGCAGSNAIYTFPISGIVNNSPATKYTFVFNDGSEPIEYTQEDIPNSITHEFNISSCGKPNNEFTLTATATNPCGTTTLDVKSIRVGQKPTANFSISPSSNKGCINEIYNFKDISNQGVEALSNGTCTTEYTEYKWEVFPASGWQFELGGQFTKDISIKFLQPGIYKVKFTIRNGCGLSTIEKDISIIAPPVAKFNITDNPSGGCINLPVTIKNQSTGELLTHKWTITPSSGYTLTSGTLTSAEPIFNFTNSGVYTIALTVTNPCGISTASSQITVKAPPTVSLPSAQAYCGAQTIAFSASSQNHRPSINANYGVISTYHWSVSGTPGATFEAGTSSSSQSPSIHFPTAGTYIVSYTATNECGTSTAATQEITIRELPPAPTAPGQTICAGQTATLAVSGAESTSMYKWYTSATAVTPGFIGAIYRSTPANTITYYVEVVDKFGCVSAIRTPITITVTKPIASNSISAPAYATICAGETPGILAGSQPTGGDEVNYKYQWQISTDNSTFTNAPGTSTEQSYTPSVSLTQDAWFRRVVTSGECGAQTSNVVQVKVTQRPVAPVVAGATICEGTGATLTVQNPPVGYAYRWYTTGQGGTAIVAGVNASGTILTTGPLTTSATYYVESISTSCASSSRTPVAVQVTPAIVNNTISGNQDLCYDQVPKELTGDAATGGDENMTYTWEVSTTSATTGFVVVSTNGNSRNYSPDKLQVPTWFRRKATSGACVTFSNVVQVLVRPQISNNTLSGDQIICAGATPAKVVGSNPQGGDNRYTYSWAISTTSATSGFSDILNATEKDYQPTALNQTTWFKRTVKSGSCTPLESLSAVEIKVQQPITDNTIVGEQVICRGEDAAQITGSSPAGGGAPYSYQWQKSDAENGVYVTIAGATAPHLAFAAGQSPTSTVWYRRVVAGGACAPNESKAVKVTVNPAITNNTIANSTPQTICTGAAPAALLGTSPSGGDGKYAFQWQSSANGSNFTNIANATEQDYTPHILTEPTWFRRLVTSGGCTAQSGAVQVIVQELITGNTISGDQAICSGETPSAFVGVKPSGGSEVYTYQWEFSTNGIEYTPIAGATQQSLQLATGLTQTTWYRRSVTGGVCAGTVSNVIEVKVTEPITNNAISSPQTICANTAPAILEGTEPLGGTGTFSYVWEKSTTGASASDYIAIAGANDKDYTSGPLDKTTWFRRRAKSGACAVISNVIAVQVQVPITDNVLLTASQSLCEGTTAATLQGSSPSGGTGSYTYVWEKTTTGPTASDFTAIANTNTPNYSPGVLTQTTWFRRKVESGVCPPSESGVVEVKITKAISANTLSPDQTICSGAQPKLIDASTPTGGDTSFVFEWQISADGSVFTAISGISSEDYQPDALTATTWYRRIVKSGACSVNSAAIKITVTPLPAAPTVAAATICSGSTATLTAVGAGDNYRWFETDKNGVALHEGVNFTTPALTGSKVYYVETVKDNCSSGSRTPVQVTVEQSITNNSITAEQTICVGNSPGELEGSAPAGGSGTYMYQWESSTDGATFTTLSGATGANYLPGVLNAHTWFRRKVLSGACAASVSNSLKITVNTGITGNKISADQTVCVGQNPELLQGLVPTGGDGVYTYQWEKSTTSASTGFAAINGATVGDYQPEVLTGTSWFRRVVSSGGCSIPSAAVKIVVQQPIANNSITTDQTICSGSAPVALMGSTPSGGAETGVAATYTYRWEASTTSASAGFMAIAGANAKDYTPAILTETTWYRRVVMAGVCQESESNTIQVTVTPSITENSLSGNQTICANTAPMVILGSNPKGGDGAFKYEWLESTNGTTFLKILGAVGKDFQPGILMETTWYQRVVTSGACTVKSLLMKVEVTPLPAAPVIAAATVTTICANGTTTLTVTGPADKYLWYAVATGGSPLHEGPSFQTPSLLQTTTYYVEAVKDNCPSATRTVVHVTVEQPIANNTISGEQVICAGALPAQLAGSLPTGGTGAYTYRWEKSTESASGGFTAIPGAIHQEYTPDVLQEPTWFRRVAISGVCAENASGAIKITVNPGITGNNITGEQRVCTGSAPATKLTGLVPSGGDASYIYRWESSTTSAIAGFAAAPGVYDTQDYQPSVLTQTTWFRRVAISGGCTNASSAVQILVDPLPVSPVVNNVVICTGASATLRVIGSTTGKYEWFTSETEITPVGQGAIYPTPLLTATTRYYVQVTDVNGCISPRAGVTVTVNPVIKNNTASASQAICTGVAPVPLRGSLPTGGDGSYSYLWEESADNSTFEPATGVNTAKDYAPSTLTQTTWYRRRINSGGCEDVSPTVQIVVNSVIANNTITGSQEICEGDTPKLFTATSPTGGDGVFTYRWESSIVGPLGNFKPADGENTKEAYQAAALTQTIWFRRIVMSGGCENFSNVIQVVVRESIKNNQVTAPQVICYGNVPADLLGTLPTGGNGLYEYVWEASTLEATSGFAPAAGNNTQQHYSPGILTQTTWYRRVVKAGASCPSVISSAVKITVNEAITGNTISAPQIICAGESPAALTGTTPSGGSGSYTYQWQVSYTGLANDFDPADGLNSKKEYVPPVLTKNTWFRRVVISAPCPPQASNMVLITVNPVIANNVVQQAQTICEKTAPAQLMGTSPSGGDGGYVYLWQISEEGPTSGFKDAAGMNNAANYQASTLTQTSWFRRVVTSGNCANASAAVQVTVNGNIANNVITEAQEICVGATPLPLTGTQPTGGDGNYTYLWESSTVGPNSGFGPANGANTNATYAPEMILQTTWFRRIVRAGPCDPHYSASVRIRVNPPISNNRISFNQALCLGNFPAALTGTAPQGGSGNYTYLWEESTVGPNSGWRPAEGDNTVANYQPAYLSRTTWFRRTVFSGGCVNTSAYVQVTVLPALSNNLISADQLICRGDVPTAIAGVLPTGGNGIYTYVWESSTDGINYTSATGDNNDQNYRSGPLSITTWYRRIVTSVPCSEDISIPVKITVAAPVSNNVIASAQTICSGLTPNLLQGSAPAGGGGTYSYLWEISTNGPTAGFSPAPGMNNGRDYQPGVLTQSTWFRRVITSLPCQSQTSTAVKVTVYPLPVAPVWQNPGARICPGGTVTLHVNNPTGTVEWYEQPQGGAVIYTGTTFVTPALNETVTYYVQAVSGQGCASAIRTPVKVEVVPPLADAGPDVTIIQGRSTQLRAAGGIKYVWSPASNLSSPTTAVTQAKPDETTTYTVTVTTKEGCVSTDEVTVTVLPKVFIPNVITQNKDGRNDDWEILNIEHYPNCRVEIFTRWGAKIFSSEGYRTRWDGTYQGKPLPVSAYYYILYLDKDEAPISGSITIIK
nr:PKD domain-containing protein [Rufibacter quisquiliarum]